MFSINSLRNAAAPVTAGLLLGMLLILEQRQFDQNTALLLALLTAVAVAECLPLAALAVVFTTLVLQSFKVFPFVLMSGVLSYVAVPFVVFFAVLGWRSRNRWIVPISAVLFAVVITVNWFRDLTWINFIFGTQLYGRGPLRSLTYAFLIFGAFAALHLGAWALGTALNNVSRSRRAQLVAEARLREKSIELAVEQERNRIARELHDVLAHSLTVIVAQADGLRFIHRAEPGSVEGISQTIAESARTALVETRRLIEGFSSGVTDQPSARVEDLVLLADRLTSSGMPVRIEQTGSPWNLTPMEHLTVYRLTQECLTNAFKHGDRDRGARMVLIWASDSVELRARSWINPSRERTQDVVETGRGIAGMKARAAAAGGWLETVQGEDSFEVIAFIPATDFRPPVPSPTAVEGAMR
jgi:signal transduction histidine kinase